MQKAKLPAESEQPDVKKQKTIDTLYGEQSRMGRILTAIRQAQEAGITREELCNIVDGNREKDKQVGIEISLIRRDLEALGFKIEGGRGRPYHFAPLTE